MLIARSVHIKILSVQAPSLSVHVRESSFVFFIARCPLPDYVHISHREKKVTTLFLFTMHGSSEPDALKPHRSSVSARPHSERWLRHYSRGCLIHWASNDHLKGCHCASLMMTTNASLIQNLQENMNSDVFSDQVGFSIWNVTA